MAKRRPPGKPRVDAAVAYPDGPPMPAPTERGGQFAELTGRFAAAMEGLGPFEPRPRLAVAVSGGADSLALALLAQEWVAGRGGKILALTVNHGLRAEASAEADLTLQRLAAFGVRGRKLTVANLPHGPALAERARDARYRILLDTCSAEGLTHLLLGHHRGDQVETVMMRALAASGARGLAGMPALAETRFVRLLRPLLDVMPERLRALLTARGIAWIEDPSNRDPRALRSRLRQAGASPAATAEGIRAVALAAREAGKDRARQDRSIARVLAERATIRPEGYAVLTPGPIEPEALGALMRTIAGAPYAPPIDRVAMLARAMRPATLGGVRIVPAGRLGPGWLLTRESRAMEGPVPARANVVWDGRFRLVSRPREGAGDIVIGALGADAIRFRNRSGPPSLVLHGLPAPRLGGLVVAVPHIGVGDPGWRLLFDPRNCAADAPFTVC